MQRFKIFGFALVLLTFVTMSSIAAAATYPQDHNGWHIGFGVGGGSAGTDVATDRTGGAMGNFRVGIPINPKVSLGIESNAWSKSEEGITLTFSATTFGVAFFPSEGLVLRGGAGLGRTTVATDFYGTTISATETGLGLHGSIGYEFRLGRTFAVGPQLDLGYTNFDGGNANWVGAGVQFNWYMIPRN